MFMTIKDGYNEVVIRWWNYLLLLCIDIVYLLAYPFIGRFYIQIIDHFNYLIKKENINLLQLIYNPNNLDPNVQKKNF